MSRQYWVETLVWATADGTAVANTTTETILTTNSIVPANYLQDGRSFRIYASGKHSTTGTPTIIFTLRWGGVAGTVITKTGTITTASGVTNAEWEIDLKGVTRTNGSSGTVLANGHALVHGGTAPTAGSATGAPAIGAMTAGGQTAPTTASLDLTADTALALTATWSAASASNTITLQQFFLETMN